MSFLRRLFGWASPNHSPEDASGTEAGEAVFAEPETPVAEPPTPPGPERPAPLACPYCAVLLDPPPARNRRCPGCRQAIVVRRVDGRLVLLTEAAVEVFEAERLRALDVIAWTAARDRWLLLATHLRVLPARREKLAAAPITADVVRASRALYLSVADRSLAAARREKRWGDVSGLLREQARALYEEAGSPVPPPDEIAALHRDGMTAVLRSLQLLSRHAELVSTGCCAPCRADDGRTFRISDEVRTPRLPHPGCPRGLCSCDWWLAVAERRKRRRRRTPAVPPAPSSSELPGVPEVPPEVEVKPAPGP